jgi:transposase
MEKRARRRFTAEYKAEVVRLVRDGGKTIGEVSRDLDLTESAVRHWVTQAGIGPSWWRCDVRLGSCGWSGRY